MTIPRVLICGSLAFDSIMSYGGQFQDHLVADQLHRLSISFEVENLRREFGGCAGNIAYNFQHLFARPAGQAVVMGTLGKDGQIYLDRIHQWGADTSHLRVLPHSYTSQCFLTTDQHNNQINTFHAGAMKECHINHVYDIKTKPTLAIIAPQGYEGMLQHVAECQEAAIPCLFDPGQGLPLFSAETLMDTINKSTWLIVNDYESTLLEHTLGKSIQKIAEHVDALIITRGELGSDIHLKHGEILSIPAVPTHYAVDPTGCGDAYRAGLLYGLAHGWSWLKMGRLASLLGSIKVEVAGGQNHIVDRAQLAERYLALFEEPLWE